MEKNDRCFLWYELYDMRCIGEYNLQKKKSYINRVETILWERYKYDINLTQSFN